MWAIMAAFFFLQASDPVVIGSQAIEEGKYDAAVAAFTQAIAAAPNDYYSHFNLALAYGYLHRDAEAAAEYRKTLELKPGLYEAQLNGGMVLLGSDQPAEALPLLQAAAEQKPEEFRPRLYLAEAQLASGDAPGAEASFRRAIELDAKSPEAHLGHARALAREGKLAEADPEYRAAAGMRPEYRETPLELAAIYDRNGQAPEAIAIYRQFPGNVGAQQQLNLLLLESREYGAAVTRLEQAYGGDASAANRDLLAKAYVLNHQPDKALPLLQQAVAEKGSDFELRMTYGRALRDTKRFPAAAAEFQRAAEMRPQDAGVWNDLAAALYLAGQYPAALNAFDRARELGADSAGNWFFRAIILDKMGQKKPALDAYQRFSALSQGKNPDQEFQARQRIRILQRELDNK